MKNAGSSLGAAMVEFAIVALLFFTVVFGIIEAGRLFYTTNTLTEMTRRGARLATVCYPYAPHITQATLFSNPEGNVTQSPIIPHISDSNVSISYLNGAGAEICGIPTNPSNIPSATFSQIALVRVRIIDYTHRLIFPPMSINLGPSISDACNGTHRVFAETVMPREALGVVCNAYDANFNCTGLRLDYCESP